MKNLSQLKCGIITICFSLFFTFSFSQGWQQVTSFGTNPGSLLMYSYVPTNIPAKAPLVVVLHGCTETATGFEGDSGWDTLSAHHKFYVIHAQQQSSNNSSTCFNWYLPTDYKRGQGEAYSIKQMIDYMKSHYSIDSSQVFVTGLSAGACMTAVMMGAYPELFAAGAIMAGAPYKSATDATSAYNVMLGSVTKTAAVWGDSVRHENPAYTGSYPRVAIFQGTSDVTVSPTNATELVKQWTNVHNTDQVADSVNSSFNGNTSIAMKQYRDATGKTVVETFMINSMAHGISVDPGTCFQQGGKTNTYSYDENFYSSFWAAEFFGLIKNPYSITGPITVTNGQTSITFSVPNHTGSTYQWSFPAGVTIVSGQNTYQVTVNWGSKAGLVTVNETTSGSCIVGPIELYVDVSTNVNVIENNIYPDEVVVFTGQSTDEIEIHTSIKNYSIYIFDYSGKQILYTSDHSGNSEISLPKALSNGVYMIKILSGNKVFNKKYLKI
jgi:poly(hydroxyalkanoate) depolymerase family esterase